MSPSELASRVAARYGSRITASYVYWKVRTDPVYAETARRLRGTSVPILDLGCGVGIMPIVLRECGVEAPIVGIDFDARKVRAAEAAVRPLRGVELRHADARTPLPAGHNVVALDMLQYVAGNAQRSILDAIAAVVPHGGRALIRTGVRDATLRYRFTWTVDRISTAARWLMSEQLRFPSRDEVMAPFEAFEHEVLPMWGRTPFNNYLFVFTRVTARAANRQG